MKLRIFELRNSQKGFALILAIGFLAILSVLGAVVMDIATRDLSDTVNTLPDQRSFQVAERSVEYALNEDMRAMLVDDPDSVIDLMVDEPATGVTHNQVIDATGPGRVLSGKVEMIFEPSLPPELTGGNSLNSAGRFYQVSIKTASNDSSSLGFEKTAHVDASLLQVLPTAGGQNVTVTDGGEAL